MSSMTNQGGGGGGGGSLWSDRQMSVKMILKNSLFNFGVIYNWELETIFGFIQPC